MIRSTTKPFNRTIEGLTKYEEVTSIEEMKLMHKKKRLPRRVKDKK